MRSPRRLNPIYPELQIFKNRRGKVRLIKGQNKTFTDKSANYSSSKPSLLYSNVRSCESMNIKIKSHWSQWSLKLVKCETKKSSTPYTSLVTNAKRGNGFVKRCWPSFITLEVSKTLAAWKFANPWLISSIKLFHRILPFVKFIENQEA